MEGPCTSSSKPFEDVNSILQNFESIRIKENASEPILESLVSVENGQDANPNEGSNGDADQHVTHAPDLYANEPLDQNYTRPKENFETTPSAHVQSQFTPMVVHLASTTPATTSIALQPMLFEELPTNAPILSYCVPISSIAYQDINEVPGRGLSYYYMRNVPNSSSQTQNKIPIEDQISREFDPLLTHMFHYAVYPIVSSSEVVSQSSNDASLEAFHRLKSNYIWLRFVPMTELRTMLEEITSELHKQLEHKNVKEIHKFRDFVWYFIESQMFQPSRPKPVYNGRLVSVDGEWQLKKAVFIDLSAEGILINVARALDPLRSSERHVAIEYIVRAYSKLFKRVNDLLLNKGIDVWESVDYADLMMHFKDILSSSMVYIDPSLDECNPAILRSRRAEQIWGVYNSLQTMSKAFPWIRDLKPSFAHHIYSIVSSSVMERIKQLDAMNLVQLYETSLQFIQSQCDISISKDTFNPLDESEHLYGIYFQRELSDTRMHCMHLICESVFAYMSRTMRLDTDYTEFIGNLPEELDRIFGWE